MTFGLTYRRNVIQVSPRRWSAATAAGSLSRLLVAHLAPLCRRAPVGPAEALQGSGHRLVCLRIDRHAKVAGPDLHAIRGPIEAAAPVHDPVAARADRDVAHVAREVRFEVLPEALAARPVATRLAEHAGCPQ